MLVIEDGTGVAGADSFVTIAGFAASEVAMFGVASVGTDAALEAALRRAWYYMGALQWKADLWPVFGGTIPSPVKLAQVVLARVEVATVGALSPAVTLGDKKVLNKVGDIGWEVMGGPATIEANRPVVTMAFDLLAPYLTRNPADVGARTFLAVRS